MRTRITLPEINKLYVLGAGASYGLSVRSSPLSQFSAEEVPLDKDFLAGLERRDSEKFKEFAKQSLQGRNKIDRANFAKQPLEQAILNRLEIYDFRATCNRRRITKAGKEKRKLENSLYLHYLALIISYCFSTSSLTHINVAKEFLNKIFLPNQNPTNYKNRIITFNYDTLLDDILLDYDNINPNKLYFDRIDEDENQLNQKTTPRQNRFDDPLMLKLHGSVNWLCEAEIFKNILIQNYSDQNVTKKFAVNCSSMEISTIENSINNLLGEGSPQDSKGQKIPLIIPPMPAKPMSSVSLLNFIWTRALEYMLAAKKIYIIGYSAPPNDKFAHALFQEGFGGKREKTEVVLVNPDLEMLSHYRKIIGKLHENISWTCYHDIRSFLKEEMEIKIPRQRRSMKESPTPQKIRKKKAILGRKYPFLSNE